MLRRLEALDEGAIGGLSELLVAVVAAGASVGFLAPLDSAEAAAGARCRDRASMYS